MINLVQKQEIILSYFREGKSQWEIHRQTAIARKTIRKYIKQYERKKKELTKEGVNKEEIIEEIISKPKYDTSNRVRRKLTNEMIDIIDGHLKENKIKSSSGRKKQQAKAIDIHEDLIDKGYDISYSTVCNYVREKKQKAKEAYIRQEYELGEVVEFDWGHLKLKIDGKMRNLEIAIFTTAKGSYRYAYVYPNQKMENFLDAHVKFISHIDGVHKTFVYDNMKQAVKKFVSKKEKIPTDDLLKLSLYYGFNYRFCNTRSGNEKGHVERSVEFVRRKAFHLKDNFKSIEEANKHLNNKLSKINSRKNSYLNGKSSTDILNEERPYLLQIKPDYDIARTKELRVNKYSVINIDQNKYSVPENLVGKFTFVKIYPQEIKIYYDNKLVATHKRSYQNHHWSIKIEHFLKTLKKKPGAFYSSTARNQMAPKLQQIYNKYYTNNTREFIDLIEIIKKNSFNKVIKAVEKLEKINKKAVTTDAIKIILERNKESKQTSVDTNSNEIEENSKKIIDLYTNFLNEQGNTSFMKGGIA